MYKKLIITFLIFFAPFTIIEQHQKDKSSKLDIEKLNMNKKNNFHSAENLIKANEANSIEIKHYWEEDNFALQKRYCLYAKKFFKNF